jgi:hypothetical protein
MGGLQGCKIIVRKCGWVFMENLCFVPIAFTQNLRRTTEKQQSLPTKSHQRSVEKLRCIVHISIFPR